MPEKKLCLKAVMANLDGKSVWTGTYSCSVCGVVFRPDARDAGILTREFEEHKLHEHTEE